MNFKDAFLYSKEFNQLGQIALVNFGDEEISAVCEDGELRTFKFEDVVVIHKLADLGEDESIFNYDIFESQIGTCYELVEAGFGDVHLYVLDAKLEREGTVTTLRFDKFMELVNADTPTYELFANKYELLTEQEDGKAEEPKKKVDVNFNIKIMSKNDADGRKLYYYAAKDKQRNQIDLIAVVFVGAALLNQEYKRIELSLDEYVEMVNSGALTSVSPAELQNYAMAMMRAANTSGHCCGGDDCGDCPYADSDEPEDDDDCDGNCDCDCEPEDFDEPEAPKDFDETEKVDDSDSDSPVCSKCFRSVPNCECELWDKQ